MTIARRFPPVHPAPLVKCCECDIATTAPVEVRYIERQSGPGFPLYACPRCAPRLVPGPHHNDVIRNR
ncbi:hypothetical protein ACFZB6_26550 [Streptomyces syringium]|uniref:hypothetical protein n=1 Tax=Streptomyces syringium TaxID=76729 RepID=UPI0036F0906B